MTKAFWATSFFSFVNLALAFACLRQWGAPEPWSRVDFLCGTYLTMRALGVLHSVVFSQAVFRSKEAMRECWGMGSSPGWIKWAALLTAGEAAVYLDYGQWHLVPALDERALRCLGLGLYVIVAVWQIWTDSHLSRRFSNDPATPKLVKDGPFRYVRHPRYASAMAGKAAFALVFGSVLGWLSSLAWMLLLLRRIRVEESDLQELFGADYESYAQRTARVLPGIY